MSRSMIKPTKWPLRPVKTQISLGIHPVWSEPSLCTLRVAEDPNLLQAKSGLIRHPGWSESSLGAQVILLILSCSGLNETQYQLHVPCCCCFILEGISYSCNLGGGGRSLAPGGLYTACLAEDLKVNILIQHVYIKRLNIHFLAIQKSSDQKGNTWWQSTGEFIMKGT